MNNNLNEIAAKFEIAFRFLESNKFGKHDVIEMTEQIDVFSDYLFEREPDDYIDGEINEDKPFFTFASKMLDEPENCRKLVYKELEEREEYELLAIIEEPISDITEKLIAELNIF